MGIQENTSLWDDVRENRSAVTVYLLIVAAAVATLFSGPCFLVSGRRSYSLVVEYLVNAQQPTHHRPVFVYARPPWCSRILVIGLHSGGVPIVLAALVIFIESSWEVAENSAVVIERYRSATISLDYFGDSIINSIADILWCATGFVIAYNLRFWRSLTLFLTTEVILVLWIRDSLMINIVMLIYPIEAIKVWQIGG